LAMTRMTRWAMVSSLMCAHHNGAGAYFDFNFRIIAKISARP